MKILALDLGKFKSVSCAFDAETQATEYWTFSTDRPYLQTLLATHQPDLVVFEACSISGWVHDLCAAYGVATIVANPNQEAWKWKNVKRKTDRDDALKLARLAALGQLVPVHIPAPQTREHRWLVKYCKTVVGRLGRVQNNIRALFVQHGLGLPTGARAWTAAGLEEIGQQRRTLAECSIDQLWRGQLDLDLVELDRQRAHLKDLDRKLDALAAADARVQLLTTAPGVGRKTAEVVATHLDQPQRFASARHVSSYAGMTPRRWQSGQTDRSGGVTKRGSRLLRAALVECAWVMLRYNPWAKELFDRLCQGQKNRKKKAIVAVARKLLVRLWAMLRDNQPWQSAAAS